MVRGIDTFRSRFASFSDQFVIIGGTACDLLFFDAGIPFRSTKDIDIVLCVEALSGDFLRAWWSFIREGGYEMQIALQGKPRYYRFVEPRQVNFPVMLELFSRHPGDLMPVEGSRITPIPTEEDVSSLSAILLDADYYEWIRSGVQIVSSLPILRTEHLIALKMHAWLDLHAKRLAGNKIDSSDIMKHRNDVFRLMQLADPEYPMNVPVKIRLDVQKFLNEQTDTFDLKSIGVRRGTAEEFLTRIHTLYGLHRV